MPSLRPQARTASSMLASTLRGVRSPKTTFFLADFEGFEVIGCGESAFDPLFSVHVYSSRIPDAAARCSTSLARSMMGLSTILPLSETTPEPLRSASSAAAMTRSA